MRKQTEELLPPCVYRKNGAYYLVRANKWTRLGSTLRDAIAAHAALTGSEPARMKRQWLDDVFLSRRSFARAKGVTFSITRAHILSLAQATNFRCAVSGIPFDLDWRAEYKRRPWKPSLDRIDPKLGYVEGNVRMVCAVANYAMNDWGLDVLERLSRAIVSRARSPQN